jgi:hypothetical protein
MKQEGCGHAPPFVYHIDGAIKLRLWYCPDCAALVKEYRARVAFDKARRSIPDTIESLL